MPSFGSSRADLITRELEEAGFTVVPPETYSAIYDPMVSKVGGLFDPMTGKPNTEKLARVHDLAYREMTDKHDVDAFLQPLVAVVKAGWYSNTATWHGVEEPTTGDDGFFAGWGLGNSYGTVGALSLRVVLADA